MGDKYIFMTLIGILCVFWGISVGVKIKIYLIDERRKKLRKNLERKRRYFRAKFLYEFIRKINTYLLVVSMIVSSMYFFCVSANVSDTDSENNNLTEKTHVVYNDPKDRLAQNKEKEVKNIFKDLYYSWFEEEGGRTKENYKAKVDELFDGREPVSDASERELQGAEKEAYDVYVDRQNEIDLAKVPDGATLEQVRQGKAKPKELDVNVYKEEYVLWEKRYYLYATAANLQQRARTAVDIQTIMMKYSEYEDDWDEIIEYAMHGIQFYLALMFYISAGESKADCCYWIAKVFYDLAQKLPDEHAEYIEHCYLMAYTFAERGLTYQSTDHQMDDHISDMIEIRDKSDKALEAY